MTANLLEVQRTVTINAPASQLYSFWRQLENLPRFMAHLETVTVGPDGRSHWVARALLGMSVEWDAEIVEDQPGKLIGWRSLPDSQVSNSGFVEFREAPGGRGTEVFVSFEYSPPAGKLGAVVARLFGEEPAQQVKDDLRRLKQLVEAGEIPTIEGQSSGRGRDKQ
jgi:uncharacterized membrane protein